MHADGEVLDLKTWNAHREFHGHIRVHVWYIYIYIKNVG